MADSARTVALVVGAGGPTGGPFSWAALDAIRERTGWEPASASEIIGTSAGAFVASEVAPHDELNPDAITSLKALANGHTFNASAPLRVVGKLRQFFGLLVARAAPMSRELAAYNVASGPFHPGASAVTVDRQHARRVQHRLRPDTAQAVVRASAAIPFANKPVDVGGRVHVDGATYSANNADLVSGAPEVVVVLAPMVAATGGNLVGRMHRAQLRCEITELVQRGCAVVAVLPSEQAHAVRRDKAKFAPEGAAAVHRL